MMKFLSFIILVFLPLFCFAAGASDILAEIATIIRNIAIASAVLMIVIGGFQWMTSAGDPSKISDAKDRIFAAILGLVIIALASVIASLVGAPTPGGAPTPPGGPGGHQPPIQPY
jgi:uncharacterized membrane protein